MPVLLPCTRIPLIRGLHAVFMTSSALFSAASQATISNFPVNAIFSDPFAIIEATTMSFGSLVSNTNATYVLDTSDSVTASGNGQVVGGTTRSGDYTIQDSSGTAIIDIGITNLTANNGVTPRNPICSYDGGPDILGCLTVGQANPGPGGRTLTVGMTIDVDGTQGNGGLANPTFDISITYN